jgi:hypothetical protein
VAAFAEPLARLEAALGLGDRRLRFEVQVEKTRSVLDNDGRAALRGIVDAAGGRLAAAHFGVYDYTAACGLAPAEQRLTHPACDFARHVMQVSLAGTGVRLADGSTAAVPPATTRPRSTPPGACTPATSATPCGTASGRAGTCTRRGSPAATAPSTPGTSPAGAGRRQGARLPRRAARPRRRARRARHRQGAHRTAQAPVHCGAVPEAGALAHSGLDRPTLLGS